MIDPESVPVEIRCRNDLDWELCWNCHGRGTVRDGYVGYNRIPCLECDQAGYKVKQECSECGEWTLSNSVQEEECENCGYVDPADPRYKQAIEQAESDNSQKSEVDNHD